MLCVTYPLPLPPGASDYRLLDNTVRFPPNSNVSNPFLVQIVDDVFVEDTEEFSVSFTIPGPARISGARRGAITRHTITIEDDDSKCAKYIIYFTALSKNVHKVRLHVHVHTHITTSTPPHTHIHTHAHPHPHPPTHPHPHTLTHDHTHTHTHTILTTYALIMNDVRTHFWKTIF